MPKSIIGATCACLSFVSFNADAVVVNTLNEIEYEWLELTETQGLSRNQIDAMLLDPTSSLYGYEYASRSLVEDLYYSYISWAGIDGWYGDPDVVTALRQLVTDFGPTYGEINPFPNAVTVDGYTVDAYAHDSFGGLYGDPDECGLNLTCLSYVHVLSDPSGLDVAAYQTAELGWDGNYSLPWHSHSNITNENVGSFLVRTAVIPIPAAIWLFGTGFIGLIGIARRKNL